MVRSGYADLPLHYGQVPSWLYERMRKLGGAIVEAIVLEYGCDEFLKRMSDPFWFQALGCVMGMDWHSSGITTSVLGALKAAINPISGELGIFFCGGRGKHSRRTPEELKTIGNRTGLDANKLIRSSRLTAKIDNTAIQDGYQIYLHSFIVTKNGKWCVVQQGMNDHTGYARRYHWHSDLIFSYVNEPHAAIYGRPQGYILNLTDRLAAKTRQGLLSVSREEPWRMMHQIKSISLPRHHGIRSENVDLKRLGGVLALTYSQQYQDFESLLLTEGLGPRTLQSLTLVSEVIYGTPSRFKDPARFSFAHGGKDGHPFPVPIRIYDESIRILREAVNKAKIGIQEKRKTIQKLHQVSLNMEKNFHPVSDLTPIIRHERKKSSEWGGKTVLDDRKNKIENLSKQLTLF